MWAIYKPEEYKEQKPKFKLKEEKIKLEFNDDLKLLLSVFKKNF